jgi:very-short-patch-repair endonuclease
MVKLTEYKNLVAQWDKIKNGDLNPDDFNHQSKKIIWWKCNKGSDHEWQSQIRSRTKNEGCPFCKNKLVCSDNNLKVKFPELAEQWHPTKNGDLKPDHIVFGSSKKVWWKCNKGSDHEWEARPSERVRFTGCPFCSNKRVSKDNNFLNNYPEIAKQWHPTKNGDLKPQNFTSGSAKRVWWKCTKADDHEWKGSIVGQTRRTALCPFCSGKRLSKTNDLNNFPKIASEFHPTKNNGLSPSDILSGSTKSIWWKCKNGHEWKTTPYSRVVKGNGCRLCSSGTSSHEIRIFTELKKLFGNDYVEWRKRFSARIEVDIFIPSLNIGIEYDGSYWHKERKTFDKKKNEFFNDLQIKVFRYRSYPLELLTNNDIRVSNEELTKEDINKLVRKINKLSKDKQIQ